MSNENIAAEEFSLFDLASAHLLVRKHDSITVPSLVDLLLDEAVSTAEEHEEDAAKYALLAAQLAAAFKLELVGV